jgi:L-fuconolactonase
MEIVDAQIHVPGPVAVWAHGEGSLLDLRTELAREAIDSVGVDAALIHAHDAVVDVAIARYPDRFAGCDYVDPKASPESLEGSIAGLRKRPGMLGLRASVLAFPGGDLNDSFKAGAYDPAFAFAEKHEIPLFVFISGHAAELATIARKHPDLQLILVHMGIPQQPYPVADDPWEQLPQVVALAQFPKIAVQFSGAPSIARTPFPYPDLWPHLHKIVEAFGPERLMWGSDFTRLRYAPGTTKRGAKAQWYGLYSDSVSFLRDTTELSPSDKEKIFSATVRSLLRWPRTSDHLAGAAL